MIVSVMIPTYATDLKDQQQEIEDQIEQANSEKQALANKISSLSNSMKQTEEQLAKKQEEIDQAEQDLIMAKLDKNVQYESMKQRIKYMYENGNVNYIEVFLESNSISDFLVKAEYIMKLSEYDRDKLKEFQRTIEKIEEQEVSLKAEYESLAALQDSLISQRKETETLLAEKASELAELQTDLSNIKEQIKKAEEEERRRKEAEEAKRREEEESKKQNASSGSSSSTTSPVVSGSNYFTHPCPGMSYQSSYFGEIRYGIGDTRPHSGHDYAAAEGTPIYAAAAGTVLIARYSSSAGYWVVIDHGNGLTTKYMHMFEMPYVTEGQKVVKGQHIGGVGTTGQSTGNHLHFQVEEYGTPVNPSKYL